WLNLPPWQARAGLAKLEPEFRRNPEHRGNPFVHLLFPAVVKVFEARQRLERTVATLRCGEALRLDAAGPEGPPPEKFGDLEVPPPLDPFTGNGFDGWYKAKDGRGVLEVPPPPGMPRQLGRNIEVGK